MVEEQACSLWVPVPEQAFITQYALLLQACWLQGACSQRHGPAGAVSCTQTALRLHTSPPADDQVTPLCRLRRKAQEWQARAEAGMQAQAALKRMRELLHAGLRLGVEVPLVSTLRAYIRAREWREAAHKVWHASGLVNFASLLGQQQHQASW